MRIPTNSILAAILSLFGYTFALYAVVGFSTVGIIGAVVSLAIGFAFIYAAKNVSNKKAFKTWWKQVEDANLEPVIRQDINVAIEIFEKNPTQLTLDKIRTLNPDAANYIAANYKKG